jgi:hypothetical protein
MRHVKRLFEVAGFQILYVGTLSAHVCYRGYVTRPLIIDVKLSPIENIGKIDVCEFSDQHPLYVDVMKLHGVKFAF